jgi:hypothetical protein
VAKRLSREEKKEQALIDLINKMFEIAGHQVTFDDAVAFGDQWFSNWTMTSEQRNEWDKWGKKYLMKKLNLYAARAEKEMLWIGLKWGLKIEENEQIKSN